MQHGTLYCGSPNQHSTVTLPSAFGTDVNPDYYLPFSLLLNNLHSEMKKSQWPFSPTFSHSYIYGIFPFACIPMSISLILFFNSSSPTKCHLPLQEITFLVALLLQRVGCRDLSFKICLINTCPQSFSSTGTFSSWQSSSSGTLLRPLLFFTTCLSMKPAHLLTSAK